MSHSRNVAFKMATGDIVANVDADNLIRRGFAEMLNRLAELRPARALFAVRDIAGQLAMYKNEWLELGGYDETLLHLDQPIRVCHFRPDCLGGMRRHLLAQNELNVKTVTERLERLIRKYFTIPTASRHVASDRLPAS